MTISSVDQEGEDISAATVAAITPSMIEDFSEVVDGARLSYPERAFLTYKDKQIRVADLIYTDSTFFTIFSFQLLEGSENKILKLTKFNCSYTFDRAQLVWVCECNRKKCPSERKGRTRSHWNFR